MDKGAIEKTTRAGRLDVPNVAAPSLDFVGERFEGDLEGLDGADGCACSVTRGAGRGAPVEGAERKLVGEGADDMLGEWRGQDGGVGRVGDDDASVGVVVGHGGRTSMAGPACKRTSPGGGGDDDEGEQEIGKPG